MIKYFTIEDLLKHYLQKKFHILSKGIFRQCIRHISHDEILPAFYAKTEKRFHCKRLLLFRTYGI